MPRPIHFEIHADTPLRAIAFYEKVFGWSFSQVEGMDYWLITTGPDDAPGINGGLLPRPAAAPEPSSGANAFVCTIDVPELDAALDDALGAGGGLALPRMAVPGTGWLAYILDTENNVLGVLEPDPSAA